MFPPYISITDFTNRAEVDAMLQVFLATAGTQLGYKLGIGSMMSFSSLYDPNSEWAMVFPAKENLPQIFTSSPYLFNVLHYADYHNRNVAASLVAAVSYCGSNLHALQLDMAWPEPDHLLPVRRENPQLKLILQIGKKAMKLEKDSPEAVAERLSTYGQTLDGVLVDRSMGNGDPMEPDLLASYLRAISKRSPQLSLVAAGGLGPLTMDLFAELVREFPGLSCDAQGRLRPSRSLKEPIEWSLARGYIPEAVRVLVASRSPNAAK